MVQAALAQPGRHCLSIPALFLDKIKSSLPVSTNQPYNPPSDSIDVKSVEKIGQARPQLMEVDVLFCFYALTDKKMR